MNPQAEIAAVYAPPLTRESGITFNYTQGPDASQIERVVVARDAITVIVDQKRSDLGVAHIRPLNLAKDQAQLLRTAIKEDKEWRRLYSEILSTLAPELASINLEGQLESMQVPWWNASLLARLDEHYDNRSLQVEAAFSHSYVESLMYSEEARKKRDLMSISGVLVTSDEKVVVGLRGGHRFADVVMTTPAGSVEYHSGKNPLFETADAEFMEELNLSNEEIHQLSLLGRVINKTHSQSSLYVFSGKTSLSFLELQNVWGRSKDQMEHKELIAIDNDPKALLEYILAHPYDPAKANQANPAATTPENIGSFLPQGAISILLYGVHTAGQEWKEKTQERLEGWLKL